MYLRLLAILLALVVAAGAVAPTVSAAPDVAGLVDDGGAPDPDPAIAVVPVALAPPVRSELLPVVLSQAERAGRLHPLLVFRPPR